MVNFFGVEDEIFLDKNVVKVLNGIAGSAKSSNVDKILRGHGIEYGRFTSTNKLRRDAESRYGGVNATIAGGLFKTVDDEFFAEERQPGLSTIVIDEILQTDSRVLKWVEGHVGQYNIIICTDTHQMLSPECGETLIKKFNEFCEKDFVLKVDLTKTYRARTPETESYYHECYDAVETGKLLYYRDKKKFPTISFSSMPYNHTDIYICHTNACENFLFEAHRIMDDYEAPLIPKGAIAKKVPKRVEKYPILSQENARGKRIGYFQPEHVGTPTRYQGSEVTTEQKLYYLVERKSRIEPREWYTVISRLYDIRNLVIVICDIPKNDELKAYNGKPVKKTKYAVIYKDVTLYGDRTLQSVCNSVDGKTVNVSYDDMKLIMETVKDTEDTHYHTDKCIFGSKKIMVGDPEKQPVGKSNSISMSSLLNKEPDFDYKYMPDFMRAFEKTQKMAYRSMLTDTLNPPSVNLDEPGRDKRDFKYGLDLKAAYPAILRFAVLPVGNQFYPRPDEYKGGVARTGKTDWYVGSADGFSGTIVCTGDIAELYAEDGWHTFYYIGTSESKTGSMMGNVIHEMAFRSVETNKKRKDIHYGLMDRPWISPVECDENGHATAYTITERQNHQLLMLAIRSIQASIMLKIKKLIYGSLTDKKGKMVCDCIYFDYNGDIQKLAEQIHTMLPQYDFRIFENSEEDKKANILYQTYDDLLTEKEIKRRRDRERIAAKRKALKAQGA